MVPIQKGMILPWYILKKVICNAIAFIVNEKHGVMVQYLKKKKTEM